MFYLFQHNNHKHKIETAKRCVFFGLLIDITDNLNVSVKDLIDF